MKKRTALKTASLAMAAAMLAACGSSAAGSAASTAATAEDGDTAATASVENDGYNADLTDIIPDETVTLTAYSQLANSSGEMTGWFAQLLKEKFNVKINIINDADGVFATRMESGNLGDIVIIAKSDNYKEAYSKGMLLDWNEDDLVTDYGPYISAHMQNALEKNAAISDGTVYGFGYDVGSSAEDLIDFTDNGGTHVDYYKKLGYPEVDTLDDVADMLIEMQKAHPTDENGKKNYAVSLFSDWDGSMAMFPKAMVSSYYGYDEFGMGFWDPEKQVYISSVGKDSPYVEGLRFYNKLYQNGALDPDSETQGYDGCSEDYRNGNAFFCPFNFLGTEMYNSVDRLAEGTAMFPVVPTQARTVNNGQNIYGGSDRIWCIGSETEYPELCMAIINWLSTPEGKLDDLYGPKGVCWDYDDDGHTVFTDLGRACITDGNTQMTDGYSGAYKDGCDQMNNTTWSRDAKNPDSNGDDYNWNHWPSNKEAAASEIEQDWRTKVGADSIDDYMASTNYMLTPGSMYSMTPKSDELTVIWNQVGDCIKTYSWKAMFASSDAEFDSIIDEMVTKAQSYGSDQCDEFMESEAALRKTAEDNAKAGK